MLIPSFGRPERLAACVASLASEIPDEVWVGIDGPDLASAASATEAWLRAGGDPSALRVQELPKRGANETRQSLLEQTDADLVLTLNDDVTVQPGWLRAHAAAHVAARSAGVSAIAVGPAPYAPVPDPTWLDRAVATTDMVFAFSKLTPGGDPLQDRGYRAAATLNWSALRSEVIEAGGFAPSDGFYGHDDLELAFRMRFAVGTRVVLAPRAVAVHDHRHTAAELLRRDYLLGASLYHYAGLNPAFAADLVGHDARAQENLDYYERYVIREQRDARAGASRFVELATVPADPVSDATITAFSYQHVVARRWLWRRGVAEAACGSIDAERALADLGVEPGSLPSGQAGIRTRSAA